MNCRSWKQVLFLGAQLAMGAGLLCWIFSRPGFLSNFATAWSGVRMEWLIAGIAAAGLSVASHVWRWCLCLRLLGIHASWSRLGAVFLASSFVGSFVIGGVGGDATRVMLLLPQHPGAGSKIMVSVIADRLCGLVSLALPALFFTAPAHEVLSSTPMGLAALRFLWGYLVFSAILFVFAFSSGTEMARRRLPSWIPGRAWMLQFSAAFQALRPKLSGFVAAVAASVIMLFLHFVTFWCAARGCGAPVSLAEMSAVLPVIEAATTIPVTPSGIGVREELFRDQLGSLCGLSAGAAVLLSLAGFACTLVWSVAGGLAAALLLPRPKNPSANHDPSTPVT